MITAERAWTVAQLWALRILVEARCSGCNVRLRVDLDGLIRARGPDYSLWNKSPRCRVIGCAGRVAFWGRDRPGSSAVKLTGERRTPEAATPRWLQRPE